VRRSCAARGNKGKRARESTELTGDGIHTGGTELTRTIGEGGGLGVGGGWGIWRYREEEARITHVLEESRTASRLAERK